MKGAMAAEEDGTRSSQALKIIALNIDQAATDEGSSWERLVVEFARTATRDREPTLLGAARPVALPACPR